jgi:ABC-type Fe3+-hydroxamate transport system substrate-binding protein
MPRDARGVDVELMVPARRVVSLVPSLTETLFDLGAGEAVVGVTDYCIFPPDIAASRIGGTKNPDIAAIRALQPDLVHVNMEENLRRHADEIATFAPIFATEPKSVADVDSLFASLGALHGVRNAAVSLQTRLKGATDVFHDRPPFTFVCPIWKDPWMWCGGDTYVSSLIASAGGINLLAAEARYPKRESSEVLALSPDVIFLPDEPYLFSQADAVTLREVSTGRIIGPFPGHLVTWHGSRTILGLEFLASLRV